MFNILGYVKLLPYALLAGGLAYGAHWFIVNQKDNQIADLTAQVETLTTHNIALQTADKVNRETIDKLDLRIKEQNEEFKKLTIRFDKIESERDRYLSIFAKHDLAKLARARAGMIETRINRGTKQVFKSIEDDTKETENADN